MNVSETAVTNAANLSLFMVNLSQRVLGDLRSTDPECSILDLKALYRGAKYVAEAIEMLPAKLSRSAGTYSHPWGVHRIKDSRGAPWVSRHVVQPAHRR